MDVVREALETDGWDVEDTSATRPYDFLAKRRNERRYVEVKGTTGDGGTVALTRNEVEHARANAGAVTLVVVSGIRLDASDPDEPTAGGGTPRWLSPWEVSEGHLRAVAYAYRLPTGSQNASDRDAVR
jgi:hypothetical protein